MNNAEYLADVDDGGLHPKAIKLLERMRQKDPTLVEVILSGICVADMSDSPTYFEWFHDFLSLLEQSKTIIIVHIYGTFFDTLYPPFKRILMKKLGQLQSLKTVHLKEGNIYTLRDVKYALRAQNLQELVIEMLSFDSQAHVDAFAKMLKSKKLTTFNFSCEQGASFEGNPRLDHIFDSLGRMRNLASVELDCDFIPMVEPDSFARLVQAPSLQSLSLGADPHWGVLDGYKHVLMSGKVISALSETTSLKHLSLSGFIQKEWDLRVEESIKELCEKNLSIDTFHMFEFYREDHESSEEDEQVASDLERYQKLEVFERIRQRARIMAMMNGAGRKRLLDATTSRADCVKVLRKQGSLIDEDDDPNDPDDEVEDAFSALYLLLRLRPDLCTASELDCLEARRGLISLREQKLKEKVARLLEAKRKLDQQIESLRPSQKPRNL